MSSVINFRPKAPSADAPRNRRVIRVEPTSDRRIELIFVAGEVEHRRVLSVSAALALSAEILGAAMHLIGRDR